MRCLDHRWFSQPCAALIIVPPFAALDKPALGPHLLRACARQTGFHVGVLYANLSLSARIGEPAYTTVAYSATRQLMGERLFAAAAYGTPPLGRDGHRIEAVRWSSAPDSSILGPDDLRALERVAARWVDDFAAAIAGLAVDVVGCTTTFQQTAASIALLKRVKSLRPETVTILGGANCEGEMADGILSLGSAVDFVFSGESDASFPEFLHAAQQGSLPRTRVIRGAPCANLDSLPTPEFAAYYEQFGYYAPDSALLNHIALPYESSRGCWWGQKHHCTFCGLNGETMAFRAKSPSRVIKDLKQLLKQHPTTFVTMVDNIMPHEFFRTLIPRLRTELPGITLFYEQKSNLSLARLVALKEAGVGVMQPGIESLSSAVLKRMDKGVTAVQNLALLRYARAADVALNWSLLYGFPGDKVSEYERMLELLPLLVHLNPPVALCPLNIDRFSPYFKDPLKYGLAQMQPWQGYASVLPDGADVAKVAYHFDADYPCEVQETSEVIVRLAESVECWRRSWERKDGPPMLAVAPLTSDQFMLFDTRGLPAAREISFMTRAQTAVVLAGARERAEEVEWALEHRYAVEVDSGIVPLATAAPELIREFETHMSSSEVAKVVSLQVMPASASG
jgi:ribosomal peptide maturation radical SAM protein 1